MPVAQFNKEPSAVQDTKFGPMPQGLPPSSSASTTQPNPYMTGTGGSLTPATPQGGPAQTPPATQVKGGVTGGVKPDSKTAAETSVDSSMADDLNSAVSSMPNKNKNKRPV